VDGPKVRIMESQVDFGLMRMGDFGERVVTVKNVCDVTANYAVTLRDVDTGFAPPPPHSLWMPCPLIYIYIYIYI